MRVQVNRPLKGSDDRDQCGYSGPDLVRRGIMSTCVRNCVVLILAMFLVTGVCALAGHAQTSSASSAKITSLTKASTRKYIAKTDTVWYAECQGKSLQNFKVVLAVQDDLLVTFVTVVQKQQFQVTPEFARALLKFNSRLDFVKVGLDDDGDIFVRCDSSVRTLDNESFGAMVDQVTASANEVYDGMSPFLSAKSPGPKQAAR
jgi:hypothetical protein